MLILASHFVPSWALVLAIALNGQLFVRFAHAETDNCIPGLECSDRNAKLAIPNTTISLSRDTDLTFDTLSIAEGTIIQAGSFHFKLKVQVLNIEGQAIVRSFDPNLTLAPPPKAQTGDQGASFPPGPNTEGPCQACTGRSGGRGGDGKPGAPGIAGQNAGAVAIEISVRMSGNLLIDARGQPGGPGGDGGKGGDGGTGEQGGRARSGVVDCSSGPGFGGPGGPGGDGGVGGNGGSGGDGGVAVLRVPQSARPSISVMADEGRGGPEGSPGPGGIGGEGGYGGRGDRLCQGQEADRKGARGADGRPRNDKERASFIGQRGKPGRAGTLVEL